MTWSVKTIRMSKPGDLIPGIVEVEFQSPGCDKGRVGGTHPLGCFTAESPQVVVETLFDAMSRHEVSVEELEDIKTAGMTLITKMDAIIREQHAQLIIPSLQERLKQIGDGVTW